jgi:hypothetical protein
MGADIVAKVHYLKTWTPYFYDIKSGVKQFQVRINDRDYEVGDTLILDNFDPSTEKYLGEWIPKLVTYKLDDIRFVKEGFVILGMRDIKV